MRRTYSNYGDRCFAAAGPKLWNSLPADLWWQADISFQWFQRLLFGCWDCGTLCIKTVPQVFLLTCQLTVDITKCHQLSLIGLTLVMCSTSVRQWSYGRLVVKLPTALPRRAYVPEWTDIRNCIGFKDSICRRMKESTWTWLLFTFVVWSDDEDGWSAGSSSTSCPCWLTQSVQVLWSSVRRHVHAKTTRMQAGYTLTYCLLGQTY